MFFPGELEGKQKKNSEVRALQFLTYDLDRGQPALDVIRGTTTTATTSACVRPRWSCVQEQPMGGVRPNASKKGQIGPSTTVRAARGDGSCPNCASALQGARETANIQAGSGVIWRIPDEIDKRAFSPFIFSRFRAFVLTGGKK